MELIEGLVRFNLTRQEAGLYVALLKEGDMNGYEAAKAAGISRSNAYNSLSSLVEKGAAYIIEGPAVKYSPVPLEEFCDNQLRSLEDTKGRVIALAPEKKQETEGYITIKGEMNILNKARHMILFARERVYISASQSILERLIPEMKMAIEGGIKLVCITNTTFDMAGTTVHYSKKNTRQLGIIADSGKVLTGDIEAGEESTCLYSQKKNLVDLFKESMKNEIKLIEITKGNEE